MAKRAGATASLVSRSEGGLSARPSRAKLGNHTSDDSVMAGRSALRRSSRVGGEGGGGEGGKGMASSSGSYGGGESGAGGTSTGATANEGDPSKNSDGDAAPADEKSGVVVSATTTTTTSIVATTIVASTTPKASEEATTKDSSLPVTPVPGSSPAPVLRERSQRRKAVEARMAEKAAKENEAADASASPRLRNVQEIIKDSPSSAARPRRSRKRPVPPGESESSGPGRKSKLKESADASPGVDKSPGVSTSSGTKDESRAPESGKRPRKSNTEHVEKAEKTLVEKEMKASADSKAGKDDKQDVLEKAKKGATKESKEVDVEKAPGAETQEEVLEKEKKSTKALTEDEKGKAKVANGEQESEEEEEEDEEDEEEEEEDIKKLGKDYFEVESIKKKRVRKVLRTYNTLSLASNNCSNQYQCLLSMRKTLYALILGTYHKCMFLEAIGFEPEHVYVAYALITLSDHKPADDAAKLVRPVSSQADLLVSSIWLESLF